MKALNGLRVGTLLLAVPWVTLLAHAGIVSYFVAASFVLWIVPWGALFIIAHLGALKPRTGERDWWSLTVLGSIWGFWLPTLDGWWSNGSRYGHSPYSEWLRLVRLHMPLWLPLMIVAAGFYLYRASRSTWRSWPLHSRLAAHAAALMGLVGFPMMFPAANAHNVETMGGPGLFILYPTANLSLVLVGAAMRSPGAVAANSLRIVMIALAMLVLTAVGAVTRGVLTPQSDFETFWHAYSWQLFHMQVLGDSFIVLAVAWITLAFLAQRPRPPMAVSSVTAAID